MRIRTIKTMVNKAIDSIAESDVDIVKRYGMPYVFGEITSLCNVASDPLIIKEALHRILRTAAIAYTLNQLANE